METDWRGVFRLLAGDSRANLNGSFGFSWPFREGGGAFYHFLFLRKGHFHLRIGGVMKGVQVLSSHLWEADLLRGAIDAVDFKTYIFPLLFFKRLSDVCDLYNVARFNWVIVNLPLSYLVRGPTRCGRN